MLLEASNLNFVTIWLCCSFVVGGWGVSMRYGDLRKVSKLASWRARAFNKTYQLVDLHTPPSRLKSATLADTKLPSEAPSVVNPHPEQQIYAGQIYLSLHPSIQIP
jgi:hypothetical protein